MIYCALLNEENVVVEVIVLPSAFSTTACLFIKDILGLQGNWVSAGTTLPAVGATYDPQTGGFTPPPIDPQWRKHFLPEKYQTTVHVLGATDAG